jgi:hypothetical protein
MWLRFAIDYCDGICNQKFVFSYCPQSATCTDLRLSPTYIHRAIAYDNRTKGCDDRTFISDVDKCPIAKSQPIDRLPQPRTIYNDNFGRNKVLPLCGAAYDTDYTAMEMCLQTHGFRLTSYLNVFCNELHEDTCFAFTAISDADRAFIVAFRFVCMFLFCSRYICVIINIWKLI